MDTRYFRQFGLTDILLYRLSETEYVVLTDDIPLWSFITGKGHAAYNFAEITNLMTLESQGRKPPR